MISYEIISTVTDSPKPRSSTRVRPGDPDYKKTVFNRVFSNCHVHEGDIIKVRKSPKRGKVMEVISDFERVTWESNRPQILIIEVDGSRYFAHPSQVKRVNPRKVATT